MIPETQKQFRTRLHYIRYTKVRCGKCKLALRTEDVGTVSKCCGSFVEVTNE